MGWFSKEIERLQNKLTSKITIHCATGERKKLAILNPRFGLTQPALGSLGHVVAHIFVGLGSKM